LTVIISVAVQYAISRGQTRTQDRDKRTYIVANVSNGGKERRRIFERERRKFESVLVKTGNVW
jgi:hypothetical protein